MPTLAPAPGETTELAQLREDNARLVAALGRLAEQLAATRAAAAPGLPQLTLVTP